MKKLEIQIAAKIPFEEIAEGLVSHHDADEIIELIKMIDLSVQDWSFTIKLADYFDEQRKAFTKERKEELSDG